MGKLIILARERYKRNLDSDRSEMTSETLRHAIYQFQATEPSFEEKQEAYELHWKLYDVLWGNYK